MDAAPLKNVEFNKKIVKFNFKYIKSSVEESGHLIGHFLITNLMPGQGLTIGNALRRVLLSNLEGTTITAIKIPGISHEFSTIDGIREDILEIFLNLKQVVLKTNDKNQIFGKICATGPGIITANSLVFDSSVEIVNPNQYIATLSLDQSIDFEIIIESGTGYIFNDERNELPPGFLAIDAVFMPILNVNYQVNHDYIKYNETSESLTLEIKTNGSITPEVALAKAANKLVIWFNEFTNKDEIKTKHLEQEIPNIQKPEIILIEELELPVRAYNCLKNAGINSVDELITYSEEEIKQIKNFGKKSANEVFQSLKDKFNIFLPALKT